MQISNVSSVRSLFFSSAFRSRVVKIKTEVSDAGNQNYHRKPMRSQRRKNKQTAHSQRRKAWVTEWHLVLVYHLIGWEEFVRFTRPITKISKPKLKQPWITRHSDGSCFSWQSFLLRPISLFFIPLQAEVPLVYSAFRMSGYTPSQVSYDVYALQTKRTAIYVWTHFCPSLTVRNNILASN